MTVTVDGTNGVTVPLGLLAVQPLVTTFTSSGTFTKRATSTVVQVLVVGGVGGAGAPGIVIVVEW